LAQQAEAIAIGSRDLVSEAEEADPFKKAREPTAGFAGQMTAKVFVGKTRASALGKSDPFVLS
jgi:hypothetical protein